MGGQPKEPSTGCRSGMDPRWCASLAADGTSFFGLRRAFLKVFRVRRLVLQTAACTPRRRPALIWLPRVWLRALAALGGAAGAKRQSSSCDAAARPARSPRDMPGRTRDGTQCCIGSTEFRAVARASPLTRNCTVGQCGRPAARVWRTSRDLVRLLQSA